MLTSRSLAPGVLRRLHEEYVDEHGPAMTVALVIALGAHSPVSRDFVDLRWSFVEPPEVVHDLEGPRLVPSPLHTDFHGARLEAHPTVSGYAFRVHTAAGLLPFHDLPTLGEALGTGPVPRPRLSTM